MSKKLEEVTPKKGPESKGKQVEEMFNEISSTYDSLNHTLSLGIDRKWRRSAIDLLGSHHPQSILDMATGTGDFAILSAERIKPQTIIGADISEGMMKVAREKVQKKALQHVISFQHEDCMNLSFNDNTFDAVTIAYGARNFECLQKGLSEMRRVLKPNGHLLLLELSTPPHFPMKQLFWLYSKIVMPAIGRLISKDRTAYTYLPESMEAFPKGEVMEQILKDVGYSHVYWKRYTFGISTVYLATK